MILGRYWTITQYRCCSIIYVSSTPVILSAHNGGLNKQGGNASSRVREFYSTPKAALIAPPKTQVLDGTVIHARWGNYWGMSSHNKLPGDLPPGASLMKNVKFKEYNDLDNYYVEYQEIKVMPEYSQLKG